MTQSSRGAISCAADGSRNIPREYSRTCPPPRRNGPHPSLLLAEVVSRQIKNATGQTKRQRIHQMFDFMLEGLRNG